MFGHGFGGEHDDNQTAGSRLPVRQKPKPMSQAARPFCEWRFRRCCKCRIYGSSAIPSV